MAEEIIDINYDLIELCKKGDRIAQNKIYKQYVKSMYNLCARMIIDKNAAQDILQDAFIKFFEQIHTFRGESTIGTWLRKIVINHCLNYLRKRKIIYEDVNKINCSSVEDDFIDDTEIPVEIVHEAIKELPEGCRIVLVLFLFENQKHKDIAQMLKISESTSKSQYQRAKQLLHKLILQKTQSN